MKHVAPSLALAAAVAVLISACGGAGAPSPGRTISSGDQDFLSYTRCVRAHGVSMADPYHRTGHSGLSISFPQPGPAASAAERSCQHYIQPVIDMKAAGGRALTARIRLPLIHYAECMRTHGIPLQDPTPEGNLNLGGGNGPGRYSPQFHAADHQCRRLLPPSIADNGTGP